MKNALIGYTGFVGSNLHAQCHFSDLYNSRNFHDMTGQVYDEIVCAGISAVKWQANKDPETDKQRILELQNVLSTVTASRFILISTIDVYPLAAHADETYDCHVASHHAYGRHRLEFEDFCTGHFPECHIIRLPGLFGEGLKKNIIYDLLNDNCLEMINPKSSFQYYYLKHLWSDIKKTIESDIKLINLFAEPVCSADIINRFFPGKIVGQKPSPEAHYDLYTRFAHIWGKHGHYIYSREEVLEQLAEYINRQRNGTIS